MISGRDRTTARRRGRIGFAIPAVAASLVLHSPAELRGQSASPLVFDSVTVVDVDAGKLVPGQRVVIIGNRIHAVGAVKKVATPKGATVVDARGRYLIPGLWDMHVHPRDKAEIFYELFLANGVTGIRDAWSDAPLENRLRWRREILAGTRVGPPRQILSSPAIDERSPCVRGANDGHTCVAPDAMDARQLVDSLKAAGYDMLKMYFLSPSTYFAVAAEARRIGLPFGGHADGIAAVDVADSGTSIVDHAQQTTPTDGILSVCMRKATASDDGCRKIAERFRRNGTWWIPTLTIYETYNPILADARSAAIAANFERTAGQFWWSDTIFAGNWLRNVVANVRDSNASAEAFQYLALARRAGMPILAGTDNMDDMTGRLVPGFSLHVELAALVAEGLSPLEALQAATLNPAKMWHATDSLGTVAPGKLADLVLLDADPLVDITNTTAIRAVVANGRYFDRTALDSVLAGVQARGP